MQLIIVIIEVTVSLFLLSFVVIGPQHLVFDGQGVMVMGCCWGQDVVSSGISRLIGCDRGELQNRSGPLLCLRSKFFSYIDLALLSGRITHP